MTDRSPRRRIWKKNWPYAYAAYEISEIDNADTVTCYGLDPNETVFAKVVNAEDPSDEITISITGNVITINDATVDDFRVMVFAFGKLAP